METQERIAELTAELNQLNGREREVLSELMRLTTPVEELQKLAQDEAPAEEKTFTDEKIAAALDCGALRGLSLEAALSKTRAAHADRRASYCYWAQHRFKSETAFCLAKRLLQEVAAVLEVLEYAATQNAAHQLAKRESVPRCQHFKAIKRAYAIAREAGLDTKADAAMRAAFSRVLGRDIQSREELDGAEWIRIGNEIKLWNLAW